MFTQVQMIRNFMPQCELISMPRVTSVFASVARKFWSLSVVWLLLFVALSGPIGVEADIYDLNGQWSDSSNPNGVWTYREGNNALPSVAAWQAGGLGGWSVAQPGWADSANGNDRIPFWFKSNGSETFAHDWLAGDVVVHSQDSFSGIGNGVSNVIWTSPIDGKATITGNTWLGREIGRSSRWNLYLNSTLLSFGDTFTGDAFSRASPFEFSAGSGGLAAISDIAVSIGDVLRLEIVSTSPGLGGEFQGINFQVSTVPEPASGAFVLGLAIFSLNFRRRRHQ